MSPYPEPTKYPDQKQKLPPTPQKARTKHDNTKPLTLMKCERGTGGLIPHKKKNYSNGSGSVIPSIWRTGILTDLPSST